MLHALIMTERKNRRPKMEDKKDVQKEFSTCLEDISFAEAMQKAKNQPETGSPVGRFRDDRETLRLENKPKNRRHEMVEAIMKLHRCSDCAIRRRAAAKPHSFLAGIHCWHAAWWPGWKIYQAELRERAATKNNPAG
jgi:hypothetical protein